MDLSARGRVEVRGGDRVALLNNLFTNDLRKFEPGAGCEGFLCDAKGRLLFYPWAFVAPESIWLDVEPGQAEALIAHLDRYVIREDVALHDHAADAVQLFVGGRGASSLLSGLLDGELPTRILHHTRTTFGGEPVYVRRVERGPAEGHDLIVPGDAAALRDALPETVEEGELDTLRVRAGLPRFGVDVDGRHIPQEVGRTERTIDFRKGCYLGQETVAKIDAVGRTNKALRQLRIEADMPPAPGTPVFAGDVQVGALGSCVAAADAGCVGLAVLKRQAFADGTAVELRPEDGAAVLATVVEAG